MFSPDLFLTHFAKHKDFSKVSKFHVEISKPLGWTSGSVNFADLRFQCESAELPGYNINTVDAKIFGVPLPVASFPTFNDMTLTFICAGDMWEKRLFDDWVNLVMPINNYEANYKNRYVSKINVTQFTEVKEAAYVVSIWNAFPVSVAPLTLNWGDDAIHKLSVTFKYDYWSTNRTQGYGIESLLQNKPADAGRNSQPQTAAPRADIKPSAVNAKTGIPVSAG